MFTRHPPCSYEGESFIGDAGVPGGSERDVLKDWFPRLQAAVESTGDRFLRVCDSQETGWLPQDDSCAASMYLKPDGVVIHEAFVDNRSEPRKPADKRTFPFLRSLIEGKTDTALGTRAMGDALQYASALFGLTGVKTRLLHVSYPLPLCMHELCDSRFVSHDVVTYALRP